MKSKWILVFVYLSSLPSFASMFGEESVPLWKLVVGQISELKSLVDLVGVGEEQQKLLTQINDGIQKTTQQIEAIESVIDRAQNLNPTSARRISDLTFQIQEMKGVLADTSEILTLKLELCDQAIAQSAMQSDTAYKMGQEMVGVGSSLAMESKTASPGRASQITAAAASSQMLATGVGLQTPAQLTQLQAMSLELQKAQLRKEVRTEEVRKEYFRKQIGTPRPMGAPRS
ncbi:hypothetical protein WDW86_12060 [Bdellovibrionota bacterium FG-2]